MLKPLADRLLVKPLDEASASPGGILLPENMKHKEPVRGRVVAIGIGKLSAGKRILSECKAGDTILYHRYAGTSVSIERGGKRDHVILQEARFWRLTMSRELSGGHRVSGWRWTAEIEAHAP